MGRRAVLSLLALAPLLGCGSEERGQLMVVVLFDALHAGHVHHLGYERETTPHLDALAEEGVSFTNALAPAPYTVASTASIMTGLLPQRHGLLRPFGPSMRPNGIALAEALQAAGWQTFGASANGNACRATSTDLGFDVWVDAFEGPGQEGSQRLQRPDGSWVHMVGADEWPDLVRAFLDVRDPSKDSFLYLHVLQPHGPYAPPDRLAQRFADPSYESSYTDERFPRGFAAGDEGLLGRANRGEVAMTAADRQHTLDLYDANLLWADEALGDLVAELQGRGLWDSTWMVVTSDHGEAFWQHGRSGHNEHLYEEMLRVPLVVRCPSEQLPRGVRSDALVSPMDLFPSIVEWFGLPSRSGLDGRSLTSALREAPARQLLLQTNGEQPRVGWTDGRSKLVASHDGAVREQFDLEADPHERTNLKGTPPPEPADGALDDAPQPVAPQGLLEVTPEAVASLEGRLVALAQALGQYIPSRRAAGQAAVGILDAADALIPSGRQHRGPDLEALLDALGYGGDGASSD